jgi:hypothetical protein
MRDNLLKEKHSGCLAGHFGHDKTFAQMSSLYYWPGMRADVKKFVEYLSTRKRQETEHWVVSTITYSRKALGCN